MYRHLQLYNFVDNHDVSRVASLLKKPAHLFPLYLLLFTIPGIPGIYYGSEWGLEGRKDPKSDWPLRPELDLGIMHKPPRPGLAEFIQQLAGVRAGSAALRLGSYQQLFVQNQQLGFVRQHEGETVVVLVNSSDQAVRVEWDAPVGCRAWRDLLGEGAGELPHRHRMVTEVPACGGLVLRAD
jgi:cyclomaltodextrinase